MALLVQQFCGGLFLSEFVSGYLKTKKRTFLRLPLLDSDRGEHAELEGSCGRRRLGPALRYLQKDFSRIYSAW